VEEVVALTTPQTTGESKNPPAVVEKVSHASRFSPHEPVLLSPVSGQTSGPNAAFTTPVVSDDLTRLIFRNGDSSPTSDVPSLSDGDSDPPSAPCEVPEFPERWPGSASGLSPVVYCNPSPGFFSPGAPPFVHPAYVPWALPKLPARSESRRHGMSARKLKALKSMMTLLLLVCRYSQLTVCRMYQLSNVNFTKKTATVPRVVFAHCKPTSRCHDPLANLLIHSIHDPSVVQSPESELESPSDSSTCSPLSPSESRSKFDEEHERNIYPITWRVIGGGVMMGGQSTYITCVLTICPPDWPEGTICTRYKDGVCPDSDDCPYTHPWEGTSGHIQVPSYVH
jgi:hypothetical protein